MTEHENIIEVLCADYSKETLKQQLKKKYDGMAKDGPDILDSASLSELKEAISRYDEEQYQCIRDAMREEWKKYNLI